MNKMKKKITKYMVAWGATPDHLEERVQTEIGEGWQPWGSMQIHTRTDTNIPAGGDGRYFQPMVKYED